MEENHFCFLIVQIQTIALDHLFGCLLFKFRAFPIKINTQQLSAWVAADVVGLTATPSEKRERIPNRTIQDGFDRTAVSPITASADDNQRITLTNERSNVLMAVISGSDVGKLYYILARSLDKLN